MVYATAVRLVGRAADAEDIAQTVFLKAYERFGDIGGSPTAAGWLKTVTTNVCLNHLSRYRNRWRFFSELDAAADGDGRAPDFASRLASPSSPAADLETAGEHARLQRALRRLPDHQRVPLVLFHYQELSYQDIAATLGVSLAKVKTDIFRGREALKAALESDHGPR